MVSEDILKFSTQKSVFSEIVFELDGKKYVCRKLIPEVMITHYEYEMALSKEGEKKPGDPKRIQEIIVDHLLFLFPDLTKDLLTKLEDDEIRMIMNQVVISKMLNRQLKNITETMKKAVRKEAEKNGLRPGKKKSERLQ